MRLPGGWVECSQGEVAMDHSHSILITGKKLLHGILSPLAERALEVFEFNNGYRRAGRATARPINAYYGPNRTGRIKIDRDFRVCLQGLGKLVAAHLDFLFEQ